MLSWNWKWTIWECLEYSSTSIEVNYLLWTSSYELLIMNLLLWPFSYEPHADINVTLPIFKLSLKHLLLSDECNVIFLERAMSWV